MEFQCPNGGIFWSLLGLLGLLVVCDLSEKNKVTEGPNMLTVPDSFYWRILYQDFNKLAHFHVLFVSKINVSY